MKKRGIYFILLALGLGIIVQGNSQAVVIEDSFMVTDVTPVQFSVVWATSEPAWGSLDVFLDQEGTIPFIEAVVISESAEHPPAEDIGVMKVRVVGLKPDTEFFFQAKSTAKNDNAVYLSPIKRVKTEKSSIIVRNDVLAQKVGIGENKPASGMLVVASVDEASYPVSGWVGHGVPDEWGAIDTNNFYDRETHVNLELEGGEIINLKLFGGSLGSVENQDIVPAEKGGIQPLNVAANLPDSGSGPTISPPTDSTDEGGAVSGASGGGSIVGGGSGSNAGGEDNSGVIAPGDDSSGGGSGGTVGGSSGNGGSSSGGGCAMSDPEETGMGVLLYLVGFCLIGRFLWRKKRGF